MGPLRVADSGAGKMGPASQWVWVVATRRAAEAVGCGAGASVRETGDGVTCTGGFAFTRGGARCVNGVRRVLRFSVFFLCVFGMEYVLWCCYAAGSFETRSRDLWLSVENLTLTERLSPQQDHRFCVDHITSE